MDASPAAVWRRPAQPGRGSRIRCVRWNRFQALRHQTPDTTSYVWFGGGRAVLYSIVGFLSSVALQSLYLHNKGTVREIMVLW